MTEPHLYAGLPRRHYTYEEALSEALRLVEHDLNRLHLTRKQWCADNGVSYTSFTNVANRTTTSPRFLLKLLECFNIRADIESVFILQLPQEQTETVLQYPQTDNSASL